MSSGLGCYMHSLLLYTTNEKNLLLSVSPASLAVRHDALAVNILDGCRVVTSGELTFRTELVCSHVTTLQHFVFYHDVLEG